MFRLTRSRTAFATALSISFVYLTLRLHQHSVKVSNVQNQASDQVKADSGPSSNQCNAANTPMALSLTSGQDLWASLYTLFQCHPPSLTDQASPPSKLPAPLLLPSSPLSASQLRSTHALVVENLPALSADLYSGRGIVILAGSYRNEFVATNLGMLRLHGSTLPVELWFRERKGGDETDSQWCNELRTKGFGVTCYWLSDYVDLPHRSVHLNRKKPAVLRNEDQQGVAAVLLSAFRDVLFLSPDVIPLVSLDSVFESPGFKAEGAVFWQDFWETRWGKWGRYVVGVGDEAVENSDDNRGIVGKSHGLGDREKLTLDKSILLIDKERHWKTLLLSLYHTHYSSFFGPLLSIDGPLDRLLGASIHASLMTLRKPYHVVPAGPEQIPREGDQGDPIGSGVSILFHLPSWSLVEQAPDASMAFLKTSIVRFGVRDLMCDKTCIDSRNASSFAKSASSLPFPLSSLINTFTYPPTLLNPHKEQHPLIVPHPRPAPRQRMIGTLVRTMGAVATSSDPLYKVLNEGRWLLSRQRLAEKGGEKMKGLEKNIWRVLERTACEGKGLGAVVDGGEGSGLCKNVRAYIGRIAEREKTKFYWWRGCGSDRAEGG